MLIRVVYRRAPWSKTNFHIGDIKVYWTELKKEKSFILKKRPLDYQKHFWNLYFEECMKVDLRIF